ncbi:MAG: hypothetical protein ACLRZ9_05795 [Eubacterium sp.]
MAEETTKPTGAELTKQEPTGAESKKEETKPTVEELMAQLASEKAEKEKYKTSLSKANTEANNYKKALREKQTAEERAAEEQAEAKRLADEENENIRKELNHIKAVNAYKNISSEKTVESLIDAVSDADHNAIATIIENEKNMAVKAAKAEWMKSRPPVNTGQYSSMSKDEIMSIENRDERRKAMAQNMDLFRR